ncbi:MAG: hypothetical protein Q9206_003072, partial [Seirophora lacunosa]
MANSASHHIPPSDQPVVANFDSAHLIIGAGVAIFHLATARVVVCYHSRDQYWFLPKGRRDAGENSGTGAEREGFEEVGSLHTQLEILSQHSWKRALQSGYRNRLLPILLRHRQPQAHSASTASSPFVTEPVWTQLMPMPRSAQYILFWYVAETLPPDLETSLTQETVTNNGAYQVPPPFPAGMTLEERMGLEGKGYEPVRHRNTGVNEEEMLYESYLLPLEEA